MNTVCKKQSISWHLPLELVIMENFIDMKDLCSISETDKHFNQFSKKYKDICNLYNIITKCKNINIIENQNYFYGNSGIDYYNDNQYWISMFKNTLTPEQLSIYYAFYVLTYHYSSRQRFDKTKWECTVFPDGFIKCFASKNDGSITLENIFDKTISFEYTHDYNNYRRCDEIIIKGNVTLNEMLFKKLFRFIKNEQIDIKCIDLITFTNIMLYKIKLT
jgi:hypothetical protein